MHQLLEEKGNAAVRLLAYGNLVQDEDPALDAERQQMFTDFKLFTPEKQQAFLKVYGYWLGDGTLSHQEHPKIIFSPNKLQDCRWLEDMFRVLGWEFVKTSSDRETTFGAASGEISTSFKFRIENRHVNQRHGQYLHAITNSRFHINNK